MKKWPVFALGNFGLAWAVFDMWKHRLNLWDQALLTAVAVLSVLVSFCYTAEKAGTQ